MRTLIQERIEEMKNRNGKYFDNRTYFGKPLNDYNIYDIENDLLIGVFEQMVKINYTQR